jgi:molybdenum cofactor biosynthesis enzyme MoaA
LRANSLRIGTGNLFRPSRELNRVIRELIRLIRESLDLTGDFNPQVKELHLSGGDPLARRNLPELQRAS